MNTWKKNLFVGTLLAWPCLVIAQTEKPTGQPRASLDLVSSVDTVSPGHRFDVGLHFRLEDGWHIYWKNSGDSGLPPSVDWSLPEGFVAGALQFPIPKQHVSPGDIVTNILEGEPILLGTITPPASISAENVSISADVQYLICKTNCVREETEVKLTLPVQADGGTPTATNEKLFQRARRALPQTSSKYLSVSAKTQPETLSPGAPFTVLLNVEIKRGYHIQSHEPLNASFIACDVFLERTAGIDLEDPTYPPPHFRTVKYLGRLSEYAGQFTIKVPGEVDSKGVGPPHRLAGVLKYQACDNKGHCFPPEGVAFDLPLSGARRAASDEGGTSGKAGIDIGSTSTSTPAGSIGRTAGSSVAAPRSGGATEQGSPEDESIGGLLRRLGLVGLLIGCFLYGLFINATPCVLPLLSIKVLGFVQQAHESRRRTLVLGLAFGAGVMILFVVLGFLAGAGKNILQYPVAVIALGVIVMALALSMLGVFTLQPPTAATKLEANIRKEGLLASFGKGTLAPVLGLACTAPFMAGMFAVATQQPPRVSFLAFLITGFGMASPYMLLGAFPHWLSFLPKPGQWMITFERIMGFLLLGMVVWLLHPLITQIGPAGLEWTLVFLVAVAMACWVLGRVNVTMSMARRWTYRGGAAAFVVLVGGIIYELIYPLEEAQARASRTAATADYNGVDELSDIPWKLCFVETAKGSLNADGTCVGADDAFCRVCKAIWDAAWEWGIPWQPWSPQAVEEAVHAGRTAFVDFTAAYCTVCKANKNAAIDTEEVRAKMKALGIVPFQGDFTTGDQAIFETLQRFDRAGVPLNLIYPAGRPDSPMVLRPNLTKGYLLEQLDEAARASQVASVSRAGA